MSRSYASAERPGALSGTAVAQDARSPETVATTMLRLTIDTPNRTEGAKLPHCATRRHRECERDEDRRRRPKLHPDAPVGGSARSAHPGTRRLRGHDPSAMLFRGWAFCGTRRGTPFGAPRSHG